MIFRAFFKMVYGYLYFFVTNIMVFNQLLLSGFKFLNGHMVLFLSWSHVIQ